MPRRHEAAGLLVSLRKDPSRLTWEPEAEYVEVVLTTMMAWR